MDASLSERVQITISAVPRSGRSRPSGSSLLQRARPLAAGHCKNHGENVFLTPPTGAVNPVGNPVAQVRHYCEYLSDFIGARSRTLVDDHEFARLVRNVYKVLLTRGLSRTIINATDERTRDKLRSLVQSRQATACPAAS